MMALDKPVCPVQPFHPQGERRVPPFLDLDLAYGGTLARVSEESGLGKLWVVGFGATYDACELHAAGSARPPRAPGYDRALPCEVDQRDPRRDGRVSTSPTAIPDSRPARPDSRTCAHRRRYAEYTSYTGRSAACPPRSGCHPRPSGGLLFWLRRPVARRPTTCTRSSTGLEDIEDYYLAADVLERLRKALDAVGRHIRPVLTRRVGVRYVNRLSGVEMTGQLPLFIRSELLGLASAELGNGEVLSELTEAAFVTDAVSLRGRWGHLPANATYEATIDPIDKPSWLLDLDAYTAATTPFDAQLCAEEAERYTAIVHGFFRWAVSDQFLEAHEATI